MALCAMLCMDLLHPRCLLLACMHENSQRMRIDSDTELLVLQCLPSGGATMWESVGAWAGLHSVANLQRACTPLAASITAVLHE